MLSVWILSMYSLIWAMFRKTSLSCFGRCPAGLSTRRHFFAGYKWLMGQRLFLYFRTALATWKEECHASLFITSGKKLGIFITSKTCSADGGLRPLLFSDPLLLWKLRTTLMIVKTSHIDGHSGKGPEWPCPGRKIKSVLGKALSWYIITCRDKSWNDSIWFREV